MIIPNQLSSHFIIHHMIIGIPWDSLMKWIIIIIIIPLLMIIALKGSLGFPQKRALRCRWWKKAVCGSWTPTLEMRNLKSWVIFSFYVVETMLILGVVYSRFTRRAFTNPVQKSAFFYGLLVPRSGCGVGSITSPQFSSFIRRLLFLYFEMLWVD